MNLETIRAYCLAKPLVEETFPFDTETLVFKVAGKMFALCSIVDFESLNLKCDPEKAIELRESFGGIQPGYHMNKKHWNTVYVNQDVNQPLILELIDHSYELVVAALPKKIRDGISIG